MVVAQQAMVHDVHEVYDDGGGSFDLRVHRVDMVLSIVEPKNKTKKA